jgi:NAD(P)H-dependent flavin oxidoreductase YrpB (nitropropane dioxygenase family)
LQAPQEGRVILKHLTDPVFIDGAWVLPFVQGGKGVGASNGKSAGAWAAENAVGTFSGTGAAIGYNNRGVEISYPHSGRLRQDRHEELVSWSVEGGILQAGIAHAASAGRGRIRVNFLKMAGGTTRTMAGVLAGTRLPEGGNMIHAVTMGAGLPGEEEAEICQREGVYLDPIVSSVMALKVLLKRNFKKWTGKFSSLIGAVVYEDPWLAGGHNGITSREDANSPESPYERVKALRKCMNENAMQDVAIIMAGGVWYLREFEHWLGNPAIGPIAFQFGSRDLLTQECPVSEDWKALILSMKEGDIALNKFSPTGFHSSAYKNAMIENLYGNIQRQVPFGTKASDAMPCPVLGSAVPGCGFHVTEADSARVASWIEAGFNMPLRTPDETLIFVTPARAREIREHRNDCVGCLATCALSAWSQDATKKYVTGKRPDPRAYCIRKSLVGAIQGEDLQQQLIFTGHKAFQAGSDPFYHGADGKISIPTVKQFVARLATGN